MIRRLFAWLGRHIDRIWPADHGFQWTGRSDGHGHTAELAESERRLEAELNRIHPGYGDLHHQGFLADAVDEHAAFLNEMFRDKKER